MPTLLTRGLGYDEPTIIKRIFGDRMVAQVTVEDTILAVVKPDDSPVAVVESVPFNVVGVVYLEDVLRGTVVAIQDIRGVLKEEGPLMSFEDNQIRMFKGDNRTLKVTLSYPDGAPVNLTGSELRFTVKEKTSDTQAQAKIKKANTAAGGDDTQFKITVAAGGACEIYLVPVDTETQNPGTYYWDVEVVLADGKRVTAVRDRITLKDDVTTSA